MNKLNKKVKKLILPVTKQEAIFIVRQYDNSESIRKDFELRKKIKKRSYCEFFRICKGFYIESYTCTHRGGDYCGAFRIFNSGDSEIPNKLRISQFGITIPLNKEGREFLSKLKKELENDLNSGDP